MHHYYNHVNFSSFMLLFSSSCGIIKYWHLGIFCQQWLFKWNDISNSEVKIASPEMCWGCAIWWWNRWRSLYMYIPRTRLLTTSWIWHRWQLTQRLFCFSFLFSLQQLFCFWFDRHFHHLVVVQKMLHRRHLPNVL